MKLHLVAALFISWPGVVAAQAPAAAPISPAPGARSKRTTAGSGWRSPGSGRRTTSSSTRGCRSRPTAPRATAPRARCLRRVVPGPAPLHLPDRPPRLRRIRAPGAGGADGTGHRGGGPGLPHVARAPARPIEGIWSAGRLRLAVVPDSAGGRGHFMAVVLVPDTATWRAGAVRATLIRRGTGAYDVELSGPNYVTWHRRAHLHKSVLLRLDPGMWGKAFPVPPADSGLVDPVDPHRPTLVVRSGAVVISMPSHDRAIKPALDSLVAANADLIRRSDLLIVDLRGNEGGSSFTAAALGPYIASREPRPSPLVHRNAVMLSSPDQIAYAKVAFGPGDQPVRPLAGVPHGGESGPVRAARYLVHRRGRARHPGDPGPAASRRAHRPRHRERGRGGRRVRAPEHARHRVR